MGREVRRGDRGKKNGEEGRGREGKDNTSVPVIGVVSAPVGVVQESGLSSRPWPRPHAR